MSRRIVFTILAAASALICAPAHADRECFENCRMPEVVDQPPAAVPAPAGPVNLESTRGAPEAAWPEVVRPRAPARRDVAPQNVSNDRPAKARAVPTSTPNSTPSSVEPRKAEAAIGASTPAPLISTRGRPRDIPPPRMVDQSASAGALPPPRRVDVSPRLPVRSAHSDRPFRGRFRPIVGSLPYVYAPYPYDVIDPVDLSDTVYADEGLVAAYQDPSWKLCQISEHGVVLYDYRYCGPYNYYPYGAYGYRPMGNYDTYRSAPARVVVPSAKIIRLERD